MKKAMMVLLLALLLMAGSVSAAEAAEADKLQVVATIFPQYDFIRAIAGDKVELTMLLKPGAEIHSYEPSPQDILAIQKSDLFVYVGGESDAWIKTILESAQSDTRKDVALMELVETTDEHGHEHDEDHEHEYTHGEDHEHEYDEHVWTSPVNTMTIVSCLTDALCELDEANADFYRANEKAYLAELTELDEAFREVVASSEKKHLVFGDRFPLTYFVLEYGLTYSAAFPGCASESEPSAATVTQLIMDIMKEQIPVVFYIELSNHQLADVLAEQTGAKAMLFYTCQNITSDDFAAGKTYLELMRMNIEPLREALS
ncbi:MAG: zinc ABC transporter substrate-binding protein [Clostridia bacterium]|nr:zinc ABC transporter substrate-binding protein [Clostridia bacterium]